MLWSGAGLVQDDFLYSPPPAQESFDAPCLEDPYLASNCVKVRRMGLLRGDAKRDLETAHGLDGHILLRNEADNRELQPGDGVLLLALLR